MLFVTREESAGGRCDSTSVRARAMAKEHSRKHVPHSLHELSLSLSPSSSSSLFPTLPLSLWTTFCLAGRRVLEHLRLDFLIVLRPVVGEEHVRLALCRGRWVGSVQQVLDPQQDLLHGDGGPCAKGPTRRIIFTRLTNSPRLPLSAVRFVTWRVRTWIGWRRGIMKKNGSND